jgi:hypothetical protein
MRWTLYVVLWVSFFCVWYAEELTKILIAVLIIVFLLHANCLYHYRFYTHV